MTVKELIKDNDFDYIAWHERILIGEELEDVFIGPCKSENGKLIPLDGDSYDKNAEIIKIEYFTNKKHNIRNGIDITVR